MPDDDLLTRRAVFTGLLKSLGSGCAQARAFYKRQTLLTGKVNTQIGFRKIIVICSHQGALVGDQHGAISLNIHNLSDIFPAVACQCSAKQGENKGGAEESKHGLQFTAFGLQGKFDGERNCLDQLHTVHWGIFKIR